MALALGKWTYEVAAQPAAEIAEWRWLYRRCPFGPMRGDMQAWLAGTQARTGKPFQLEKAMNIFNFAPARKPRLQKANAKKVGAKLKALFGGQGPTE